MPFDARAARGVDTNDKSVVVMGVGAILQRVLGRPTGMKRAREDAMTTTATAAAEARDAERRRKRAEDEDFDARDDSDAFASVDDDSNDSTRSGEEERIRELLEKD